MARTKKKRENGSGTIYKRPDGRWVAQYTSTRDPRTGKKRRHTIYGDTQQEVAEKLRAATASIDNHTFQEPKKITIADYVAEYRFSHIAMLSPTTQRTYEIILKNYILPAFGDLKLTELTHRQVQLFISSLYTGGNPLSPKTIRNIHGILHGLLACACQDEILLRNVADHCRLPRVTQQQLNVLTTTELSRFFAAIKTDEFHLLYYTAILTGMRQAEILGLRWDDIEWERNTIVVRQQLQQRRDKGLYDYYLKPPKENKQRRIVVAPSVMDALKRRRKEQNEARLAAGSKWNNPFDLVFTNEFGRPLNNQTVYKHLQRVLKKCDLGQYTFHSLRHSFATISLENGDDIKTVQTNLGHFAPSFTLKTYAHVTDKMQQKSAARMEEMLKNLPSAT